MVEVGPQPLPCERRSGVRLRLGAHPPPPSAMESTLWLQEGGDQETQDEGHHAQGIYRQPLDSKGRSVVETFDLMNLVKRLGPRLCAVERCQKCPAIVVGPLFEFVGSKEWGLGVRRLVGEGERVLPVEAVVGFSWVVRG